MTVSPLAIETNLGRGVWMIGAAFTFRVLITSDGTSTGTATNNTGWTYELVLRRSDGTLVTSWSGSSITYSSVNGTSDAVDVAILRADTLGLLPGTYNWALWRTDNPNDRPAAYGTVYLTQAAAQSS